MVMYNKIHFLYLLQLQQLLEMAIHTHVQMHAYAWFCLQRHLVYLRDVAKKCSTRAKELLACSVYHTFTLNKPTVYTSSVRPCLWHCKPHHIELCFPLFIARKVAKKCGQLLSTYSALQLTVSSKQALEKTLSYWVSIWVVSRG